MAVFLVLLWIERVVAPRKWKRNIDVMRAVRQVKNVSIAEVDTAIGLVSQLFHWTENEVFAVPRRFRSEPVGTSWILVGNFGVEGLPNKQETTLTSSNQIPIGTGFPIGSTGSESKQFPTGSDWF